jgi:hypothetical protein
LIEALNEVQPEMRRCGTRGRRGNPNKKDEDRSEGKACGE